MIKKNIYITIRENLKDEYRHMAIPQTGAAVIPTDSNNKILLVRKSFGKKWVVPGGVQELGEDFRYVGKRELLEETGIDFPEEKLILIDIITGEGRHKKYPNGDEVYNNTVLFHAPNIENYNIDLSNEDYVDDGNGNYILTKESLEYGFFPIDNLPDGFDDLDLIEAYKNYLKREK